MDPITIAAVISATSAIAQAYNSEKTRGGNKSRLDALRRQFESIVPPEYDISVNDPPKLIEQSLKAANIDFSKLSPEAFKVVGQYAPEAAQYVAEKNPTLVQGSANQKEGRAAQLEALRSMQSVAKGESPEMAIMLQRARDNSEATAQSRQQSIMQDAQRRGLGGSGLEFAAQLQGSSDAMSRGAALSQDAALAAYKDKLAAIQNSGQMGRQLSSDELQQEGGNADIINSFNQRTSRAYQDYLTNRANMQNQAQQINLTRQQDIANRNVAQNNETDQYNQQNHNRLSQQAYDNTRDERNYQNTLATQKAAWSAQEKARQNDLKSRSYGDQMQKAGAMQGITTMQNQQSTQQTQDQNSAIAGIAGAGSGYFSGQASANAQQAAQAREDMRWDKYVTARYPSQKHATNSTDDDLWNDSRGVYA